ncbi:MAG TPA: hypothetical protein VFK30_00465, partial [Anaerolineae bacterium]|nr:hypothetical protein [Anaerolineae bacterium]
VRGQLFEKYQSNMGPDGLHMADNLYLGLSPNTADPGGHQSWGLRRSLSQIMAADLVITPDTGAAWACAFEPMPKIVMVSHASVENISAGWKNTVTLHANPQRVDCWPCHRLHSDPSTCRPAKDMGSSAACMADISVETIVETAARLLRKDNVISLHDEAAA